MPAEIKRGSFWIAGRVALVAAALAILAAVFSAPRKIPDQSSLAIAYIRQWQATGRKPDNRVSEYYKFTVGKKTILAIPVDPRQKSLYAAGTGPIRFSPGTQAANLDSPPIN